MDKKISQLTGATTPLTGTEELAIVQGGSTVKATAQDVADLAPQELPTQVVGDAGKFLQADGVGGVSYQSAGGGLPYLVYTALLTQSSTNAPVATVLQNTIGPIMWQRNGVGSYNTDIVFNSSKTFVITNSGFGFISSSIAGGGPLANKVNLDNYSSVDNGQAWTKLDGIVNSYIEIRIYP